MSIIRVVSNLKVGRMRLLAMRWLSGTVIPGESKVQLKKPEGESGFFKYSRNVSRDPKIKDEYKALKGDTPKRFDFDGRTRKRCELMEILQDQMLEAAKKRGTRT
ncbi:hypothetical protein DICVIV_07826 [Dictyocaulus viviparus]|uniref:Uncharacterized protein n=1 Tax=Dictyocaulus viviparus TaxID=29172 RepID=A0A0D8XUS6_DICVI|nr:hypothetical protein DICVIV_07826 [Dictyocaulus viviparus]